MGSKPVMSVGVQASLIWTNDGLPDLFMVGHVYPEVERTLPQYKKKKKKKKCAFGDFENDGVIDILIINPKEPPSLLRNDLRGTMNHWIKVKLEGAKSNRSGHRSHSF